MGSRRGLWNGHINFGLINIPVSLFSVEEHDTVHFHLIDSRNHARVRNRRVNDKTGEEVPWDKIVKGYEYEKNEYVLFSKGELDSIAPEATQSLDLEEFVPAHEISPLFIDRFYYVKPGKKAEKSYVLLSETLRHTGMAGIGKIVLRTRQYLSALFSQDDVLVLALLHSPEELKDIKDLNIPSKEDLRQSIKSTEINLAEKLIKSMAKKWKPEKFEDEYQAALRRHIENKIKKGQTDVIEEIETPSRRREGATVIDIAELLRKSLKDKEPAKTRRRKRS